MEKMQFLGSQIRLLEAARVNASILEEDLEKFEAFLPDLFTQTYLDAYRAAIEEAANTLSDEIIRDRMVQKTKRVEEAEKECRRLYMQARFFIERAFSKESGIWDEFGYDDYRDTRNSAAKLEQFMRMFIRVMDRYTNELLAAGLTQDMQDGIRANAKQLDECLADQKLYQKKRKSFTQARIQNYNAVWEKLSEVCRVGKMLFADNRVKWEMYLLPRSFSRGGGDPTIVVPAQSSQVVLDGTLTEDAIYQVKNIGSVTLRFYSANTAEDALPSSLDSLVAIEPEEVHMLSLEELGDPQNRVLMAYNQNGTDGQFLLEVME